MKNSGSTRDPEGRDKAGNTGEGEGERRWRDKAETCEEMERYGLVGCDVVSLSPGRAEPG